jgi:putative transposase
MTKCPPFQYFATSPEIIRLPAMMYVQYLLSRSNVEDLLHGRGIEVSHENVRVWWNRFSLCSSAKGGGQVKEN